MNPLIPQAEPESRAQAFSFNYEAIAVLLLVIIVFLCLGILFTWLDARDTALENKELEAQIIKLKKPKIVTCLFTQHNVIHQYPNCRVVADKYTRLD